MCASRLSMKDAWRVTMPRAGCCCVERERGQPMEKRTIGSAGTDPPLALACPAQRLCRRAPLWLAECRRRTEPAPRALFIGPRPGDQTTAQHRTVALPLLPGAHALCRAHPAGARPTAQPHRSSFRRMTFIPAHFQTASREFYTLRKRYLLPESY